MMQAKHVAELLGRTYARYKKDGALYMSPRPAVSKARAIALLIALHDIGKVNSVYYEHVDAEKLKPSDRWLRLSGSAEPGGAPDELALALEKLPEGTTPETSGSLFLDCIERAFRTTQLFDRVRAHMRARLRFSAAMASAKQHVVSGAGTSFDDVDVSLAGQTKDGGDGAASDDSLAAQPTSWGRGFGGGWHGGWHPRFGFGGFGGFGAGLLLGELAAAPMVVSSIAAADAVADQAAAAREAAAVQQAAAIAAARQPVYTAPPPQPQVIVLQQQPTQPQYLPPPVQRSRVPAYDEPQSQQYDSEL